MTQNRSVNLQSNQSNMEMPKEKGEFFTFPQCAIPSPEITITRPPTHPFCCGPIQPDSLLPAATPLSDGVIHYPKYFTQNAEAEKGGLLLRSTPHTQLEPRKFVQNKKPQHLPAANRTNKRPTECVAPAARGMNVRVCILFFICFFQKAPRKKSAQCL